MTKVNAKSEAKVELNTYPELPTKSARIRAMFKDGHKRGAIAKALGIRYQHVRNVLVTPIKGASSTV